MKKLIFSWLLSILILSAANAQYGTQRTGYEGDHFSLEGAIELFKHSNTIQDFERRINTEDNWVNNLDLNYDGRIDYIRVEHRRQGNFHAIILQVPINRSDVQDVAVIEIEKVGRRKAMLQIIGDEDLYGEEVIVEPLEGDGYTDSRDGSNSDYDYYPGYVNVYYWAPVQHILGRRYRVYASPFRWQYYPTWWSPWSPYGWDVYHPRIVVYHRHYHVVHVHRVFRVHNFYRPYRSYCPSVVQRTNKVRVRQGKSPVRRSGVQQNKNRVARQSGNNKVVKKRNASSTRTKVTQESTLTKTQRSTNKIEKNSKSKTKAQSANTTGKVKRSSSSKTSSSTQRTTPKVRKQRSSTKKQSQRSSVNRKSTAPSSNKRATRSNTTKKKPSASNQRSAPKVKKQRSNTNKQSQRSSASRKSKTSSSSKKATRNTATKKNKVKRQQKK